ncbi:lipase family protein [Nocardia rhizosphaerae]|uniref:Lipase family protein n=1 Tax=Nocardia rhizosphaerae TaxID=1691571 RepID=A0ABV8LAE7_9NOCA
MRTGILRAVAAAVVACSALVTTSCAGDTADAAGVALGTPQSDFYAPPAEAVPGRHGSVIRTRALTGVPTVRGASNHLVLYRSVDARNTPVAVSGTLAVPAGAPPEGGWPLVVWGPGTSGVADDCAPSRTGGSSPSADDQARWVAAGYAVAKTDYQGLGTPGPHGYLIGDTEQRAMADLATAAREVDASVGTRWVAMGHSQGGHAALFAAGAAAAWTPESPLLGAVALAPVSHIGEQVRMAKWTVGNPLGKLGAGDIGSFVPLLVRGAQTVTELDPGRFLTGRAVELLPSADTECAAALRDSSRWGGLSPREVFTSDGDLSELLRVLDDNDPSGVRFTVPVLVLQGRDDLTVPLTSTDAMVAEQQLRGQTVDYRKFDDTDHSAIIGASFTDALGWVDTRFGITR